MTTPPPNADELVSAYLDGEAAPDEIALVEANEELLGRVEAMRALSEGLRAPIEAPADLRETHIAAALGAFDGLMAGAAGPAQVTSLAAERTRRRGHRRINGLIAAAAAALLLFVGITALTVNRTNDGFDTASSPAEDTAASTDAAADSSATLDAQRSAPAPEAADSAAMAAPADADAGAAGGAVAAESVQDDAASEPMTQQSMAADEAADGAAAEEEAPLAASTLQAGEMDFFFGSFDSAESVRDVLADRRLFDDLQARVAAEPDGSPPSCQAEVDELAESTEPTFLGVAEVDGAIVEVHTTPDGATILLIDPTDCTVTDRVDTADS